MISRPSFAAMAAPRQSGADLYRRAGVVDYDRYDYDRSDRYEGRYRRAGRGDVSADALIRRADQVAREAERLYESGRLSRDHRDRTLDKLQRVYSNARGGYVTASRYEADMDWIEGTRDTMYEWSRANRGTRYRRRR